MPGATQMPKELSPAAEQTGTQSVWPGQARLARNAMNRSQGLGGNAEAATGHGRHELQ